MDEARRSRYKDKCDFISDSIDLIPQKIEGEMERKATFYIIQTSIEAATDLAAMLLRDIGETVADDYSNIELLESKGAIDDSLSTRLKKCNGLRNYLVHRYNGVDEEIALESVEEVVSTLTEFLSTVERCLNEFG